MKKLIVLIVINIIIWGFVGFELAYYEPCPANPPPARLHGPTLSVALHSTICL